MSKLARFRSRHGEPKRNPPPMTDLAEVILPGFAAFAAARVVTRMATVQISKRYPKAGRHAGAIASVGSFVAAWFGAHRIRYLAKYHDAIVIGTGLAAMQSLVQLYLPKLGAALGDPGPAPKQLAMPVATSRRAPQVAAAPAPVPAGFKPTTANEWYTYNDSFDAGGYKGTVEVPDAQASPAPASDPEETSINDLLDNSDLQLDNSDLGLS